MTEEQTEPFLTLELRHEQPALTFSSPELFVSWIKKEREFWEWANTSPPVTSLYNQSNQQWQQLEQNLNVYIKNANPQTLGQIKKHAAQILSYGVQLTSEDPRSQFAKDVFNEDIAEAGYVLQQFLRSLSINAKSLAAAVRATLFELRVSRESSNAEQKSLGKIRENWSQFVKETSAISSTLKASQNNLESAYQKILLEKTSEFDAAIEEITSKSKEQLEHGQNELEQLTHTYDEKLAVQSSVAYWTDRAKSHRDTAKKTLRFVVIYVAVLAVGLALVSWNAAKMVTVEQALAFANSELIKSYWPVALILGVGLLLIWPIRIAARLYLSSVHLAIAADERVTMVNTFLALLRTDKAVEQEDRRLILESLFRHLATGIVKDDGAPSNPIIEGANRMVSGS